MLKDLIKIHLINIFVIGLVVISCSDNDKRLKNRPTIASFLATESVDPTPFGTATSTSSSVARPTGKIFINKDFCACETKKPDILNNCHSFCQDKDTKVPTLYGSVSLGPEVELDPQFGNLFNWCKVEISDGKTNPNCQLEAWDGTDKILIDLNIPTNGNSFSADISSLRRNQTYVMTVVESASGSNARTNSFQIRRALYMEDVPSSGPLKINPVNQYICLNRSIQSVPNNSTTPDELYLLAVKRHFYYSPTNYPPALPAGTVNAVCHDANRFGRDDGALFPRLYLEEQVFNLWSESDARFADLNANSKLDVNDLIQERLSTEFGVTSSIAIFSRINWPNYPSSSNDNLPKLGFIMSPWVDAATSKAFCPKQAQYQGNNAIFKILKEVVGVDTEGLYMGESEAQSYRDSNGQMQLFPADTILIREGVLKKIWFYIENQLPITLNETTATTQTIMVYWPPDFNYPKVKKASQRLYTIKHPSQIGNQARTDLQTSIPPSDKRFACIPSRD